MEASPASKGLRVALVTSWPPRWCGIAIYSENLARALRNAGAEVHVVCHTDGGRPGEERIHPVLDQGDPLWPYRLYEKVEEVNPDVVHIQHEFGLYARYLEPEIYDFSPSRAFELTWPLFRWKVEGRPVVVTYHSVFSRLTFEEACYYDHTFSLASANIVHEPYQRECLPYNLGRVPENVFVCPHGTWPSPATAASRRRARERLGLPPGPVVGMMGWWEPNKGFERLIRMWPEIAARTGAHLVLAGEARPGSPTGPATREEYLREVENSPAREKIAVIRGTFTREEYEEVLHSFELMVLPYHYASQSGNLAHAYGAGLPVVVSAIEGLKSSVEASGGGLAVRSDRELKEAVLKLLEDGGLRRRLALASRRYARKVIAWPRVARHHLEIYRWARRQAERKRKERRYLDHRVHV